MDKTMWVEAEMFDMITKIVKANCIDLEVQIEHATSNYTVSAGERGEFLLLCRLPRWKDGEELLRVPFDPTAPETGVMFMAGWFAGYDTGYDNGYDNGNESAWNGFREYEERND